MTIIRSSVLGFCMGVSRAIDMARAAVKENTKRIFSLGPLVHNPRVLDELNTLGLEVLDKVPEKFTNTAVIIRAHGIAPQLEQEIKKRGGRLIDATCPYVKKNQLAAQKFFDSGVRLFVAGEAGHAEIAGIKGYAPSCIVVGNAAEAEAAAKALYTVQPYAKTAIIAQTTIDEHEYDNITKEIKAIFPLLEIVKTICSATKMRQDSLRELLGKVDAVIIAGGRESANTRRLAAVAKEHGTPCALVESADDIPLDFFSCETIGLAAGASAPDIVIDEIEKALQGK